MPKGKLSQALLSALDDAASKTEVEALFNTLLETLKKYKEALDQTTATNKDEMIAEVQTFISRLEDLERKLTERVDTSDRTNRSDNRTTMRLIDQKMADLRFELLNALPEAYDDGELRDLIQDVRKLIPVIPDAFDPSDILLELAEHEKEIEELKKRPIGGRGGGTSAIGVAQAFKHIGHTEQPSGTIDGVNTTFTVQNTIFWVAGFTLNGEQIAELPNFTVSGKTITFSSAIPAAYSGKDFECKYIGF